MIWAGWYLFAFALVSSALLTPLCRTLALRTGFLDTPGPRKLQSEPVPYLGGLAVFLSFALVLGGHLGA
ncbi:MAG: hypothetical protein AB1405_15185, partial [Bdellovibrionota bacterium]